jgi:hypothetical protein
MRAYNICTISSHALGDLSRALQEALQELGFNAFYADKMVAHDATNIFLDSSLLHDWSIVPPDSILYNLEQLESGSRLVTDTYLEAISRHQVWDYSRKNIAFLRERGIAAHYVPIGFASSLVRPRVQTPQDIDILFYGCLNERRSAVIEELKTFANVVALTGVYGDDLFNLISRSKIVLNLHFYDSSIFEAVRVSYLLANRKAVVSEVNANTDIPGHYVGSVCAAPYELIPKVCRQLLENESQRHYFEEIGNKIFTQFPQSQFISSYLSSFHE